MGKAAAWSVCLLVPAEDSAAGAAGGTDHSAAAAGWAGGRSVRRTYTCGGRPRSGPSGHGLRRPGEGLVIRQLVLQDGRRLETQRSRTGDLQAV